MFGPFAVWWIHRLLGCSFSLIVERAKKKAESNGGLNLFAFMQNNLLLDSCIFETGKEQKEKKKAKPNGVLD